MAVIGLTATADTSQKQHIIYDYPLARALADKLVKTPVLVGRTDDHDDLGAKLADGITLLDAKKREADTHRAAHGGRKINPVMLVVAESIDQANSVGEILARPALLGDKAAGEVLIIHNQSTDDALAQLDAVEDEDSPIRVIVNVAMLKEGWDVKNVYVIASLRPSVSETLTEQTLGRGLRLPYGNHTGNELLDGRSPGARSVREAHAGRRQPDQGPDRGACSCHDPAAWCHKWRGSALRDRPGRAQFRPATWGRRCHLAVGSRWRPHACSRE